MPDETQNTSKRTRLTFFGCTGLLVLTCAVKWLWLDRAILALRQTFQIDAGLLFACRMARLTILLCAFLLPPLAIKAKFRSPQWVIWLLFAAGAGFDLWYLYIYVTMAGLLPLTELYTKTWTLMYYTEQNMLYLVLPQLPIALAVAMGSRRSKTKPNEVEQEPLAPPLDGPVPTEEPPLRD